MTAAIIRDLEALHRTLAGRREALGLSQSDLDAAANLPAGTIRKFEAGLRHMDAIDLPAVLGVLRLKLELRVRPQGGAMKGVAA